MTPNGNRPDDGDWMSPVFSGFHSLYLLETNAILKTSTALSLEEQANLKIRNGHGYVEKASLNFHSDLLLVILVIPKIRNAYLLETLAIPESGKGFFIPIRLPGLLGMQIEK